MIDTSVMPNPGQMAPASTPTAPTPSPMQSGMTTPSMSTTPSVSANPMASATSPISSAPEMPDFTKTDLGFSTPAQMASMSPAPEAPSMPSAPMTPSAAPSMGMGSSSLAESPAVSTPAETPMAAPMMTPPAADPQSLINQTLNQVGTAPSMGAAPAPAAMPGMMGSSMPNVGTSGAQPSTNPMMPNMSQPNMDN